MVPILDKHSGDGGTIGFHGLFLRYINYNFDRRRGGMPVAYHIYYTRRVHAFAYIILKCMATKKGTDAVMKRQIFFFVNGEGRQTQRNAKIN